MIEHMRNIEIEEMMTNWHTIFALGSFPMATVSPSYEGRVMQSIPYGWNCFADEVNYNPNTP